ncbi:MAG: EAL domain-containing protein [Anaerolineaceae bacterium]|nr:EAL domain-containing protein [Anaerolineaceae bacterium]
MTLPRTQANEFLLFRAASTLFIGLLLVQLALTQFPAGRVRVVVSNLIFPFFILLPSAFLLLAARRTHPHSPQFARALRFFAAAILVNLVGQILWSSQEIWKGKAPHPSIADAFFLLSYPLFLVGAYLASRKKSSRQENIKNFLDSSVIVLSALLGYWVLILGPQLLKGGTDKLAGVISIAYPIGDILILWGATHLIYNPADLPDKRPAQLLTIGAILLIINDTFSALQVENTLYLTGGYTDFGWALACFFFFQAARAQIESVSRGGEAGTGYSSVFSGILNKVEHWAAYYPYIFVILPFFIIAWHPDRAFLISNFTLALWTSVLITMVFIRQTISIRENRALNKQLSKALEEVQAKTQALEKSNLELQSEITEHRASKKLLVYKALHDSLTGLPNRAYLLDRLKHILKFSKKYSAIQSAVLYLDFDHFKVVNDSLGHTTGDQLLIQIASRLEACVRERDMVGRIGGDEFVIILCEDCDTSAVEKITRRIVKVFSKPFDLGNGKKIFISTSIGIVERLGNYELPEDILRDADIAMYYAKSLGRNHYRFYEEGMRERMTFKLEIEHDLLNALERGEFELHYQPILSLQDLHLAGFEALIRWNHPQRGMISPLEFIPICEENGLIYKLGAWVLQEACAQTALWHTANPALKTLSIHVNISGSQICHPHFINQVTHALEKTGIDPRSLRIEVTESVFIKNTKAALNAFEKLRELGIEYELDDFGSGYSSLKYLHTFPIRNIKIDRSFIQAIQPGEKPEIVRAILSLVHNLDIRLTAEGIETEYQLKELANLGCHFGQGFLFSKPLNRHAAEEYLKNQPVFRLSE